VCPGPLPTAFADGSARSSEYRTGSGSALRAKRDYEGGTVGEGGKHADMPWDEGTLRQVQTLILAARMSTYLLASRCGFVYMLAA
jgi:hypothetical protein